MTLSTTDVCYGHLCLAFPYSVTVTMFRLRDQSGVIKNNTQIKYCLDKIDKYFGGNSPCHSDIRGLGGKVKPVLQIRNFYFWEEMLVQNWSSVWYEV